MVILVLLTVIMAGLAGLAMKKILEMQHARGQISWREFYIGMAATPVLAVLVAWAGWSMARHSNMTFSEYWNGWETAAVKTSIICKEDGRCRWDYDCHPYIVMVSYSCNCDKNNNCSTCYRPETRYHSCPYVAQEYNYSVQSTLGSFQIASNVFPDDPQRHRWPEEPRQVIPQYVISQAGVGDPPYWLEVKRRMDANAPGPVSMKHDYPNYILASERTLMKQYSSDIEDYRKANVLPDLPKKIQGFYTTDKIRFVGFVPVDVMQWKRNLEYLNAALGSQLQGDLMVVIVKNALVSGNPDRYVLALKAYWQDKVSQGHEALPKNALVIAMGTDDGQTVSWSRGFTAMPMGNEKLTVTLRDGLKGLLLKPEAILGPAFSFRDVHGIHYPPEGTTAAALPSLLWGRDDPTTKFQRISMSGKDGNGGFLYLKGEIQPTSGQTWAIAIVTFLFCMLVWVVAIMHYDPTEGSINLRRFLPRTSRRS